MTAVARTSAVTFIHVSLKVSHVMTCPAIQNICTILISARDENWPLVQCTESGRHFAELHDPQSRNRSENSGGAGGLLLCTCRPKEAHSSE